MTLMVRAVTSNALKIEAALTPPVRVTYSASPIVHPCLSALGRGDAQSGTIDHLLFACPSVRVPLPRPCAHGDA